MSISAGDAKCAHARHCRPGILRQARQLTGDHKRIIVPGNGRVELPQVEIWGNHAMLEDQRRLDQSRDSRGPFGVPEVGFHGADVTRSSWRPVGREHVAQRGNFNGVARNRPGAVSFDVPHLAGRQPGVAVGQAQHSLLTLPCRGRHVAAGAAVVVNGTAANYCVDRVAVGQCVGERLENDYSGSLAANIPIRTGVSELAPAVRRHHF